MTDIVDKLRNVAFVTPSDCREAADEIERLRTLNAITDTANTVLQQEVERLRILCAGHAFEGEATPSSPS